MPCTKYKLSVLVYSRSCADSELIPDDSSSLTKLLKLYSCILVSICGAIKSAKT